MKTTNNIATHYQIRSLFFKQTKMSPDPNPELEPLTFSLFLTELILGLKLVIGLSKRVAEAGGG